MLTRLHSVMERYVLLAENVKLLFANLPFVMVNVGTETMWLDV